MDVHRGDIVIVELDPTKGSEQRGTRPRLVVQNTVGNENAPTTIVVPFTTSVADELYPFEVLVTATFEQILLRCVVKSERCRPTTGSKPSSDPVLTSA
jgi:mRNA interferase MazF